MLKRKRRVFKNKEDFMNHMHSKKFYMMLLVFVTFTGLLVWDKISEAIYQALMTFILPIWFVADSAHEAWKKYVDSEMINVDNNKVKDNKKDD